MKISGQLGTIEKIIIDAAIKKINRGLAAAIPDIRNTAEILVEKALVNSKEYTSILVGELKGHFGLSSPSTILQQIVDTLKKEIYIDYKPFHYAGAGVITGGIDIKIIKKDMSSILSLPGAKYYSNKHLIPWLDWLLFSNDTIALVKNYQITFDLTAQQRVRSRSKKALMIREPGASYNFPRQYGGGQEGNWIIRAMEDSVSLPLQIYIEEAFLQRIPN